MVDIRDRIYDGMRSLHVTCIDTFERFVFYQGQGEGKGRVYILVIKREDEHPGSPFFSSMP